MYETFNSKWIVRIMGLDIIIEFAYIHDKGSLEDNVLEKGGSQGS